MISLLAAALLLVPAGVRAQSSAPLAEKSRAASQLLGMVQGAGSGVFEASSLLPAPFPAVPPAGLRPPIEFSAPSTAGMKVYFSDEADVKARLVQAIDASNESVEMAIFGFSLQEVADALVRAKGRGVAVRVVINQNHVFPVRTRTKEVQFLLDQGIELRTLRGTRSYGVQHNKIGLFDRKTLKLGSFNWTYAANNFNYENALFTTGSAYVAGFAAYWDYMWALARPFSAGPTGEVPSGGYPTPPACQGTVGFNGAQFPVCAFSPLGQTEARLLKAIELSKSSIDVASYSFYSVPLAQALVAARDRGVKVRVLMDRDMGKKTQITRYFVENNIAIKWMTGRGKGAMHHKFAVYDGVFMETGSFNWTANAEANDFENVLFTADAATARSYAGKFQELYGLAKAPALEQLPPPPPDDGGAASASETVE
ncbi:MAG: hypothetical protein HY927_07070 [Elusimicrobia bacterium]|nr:hypothetical protein [Elusimicrobiota bacterium]